MTSPLKWCVLSVLVLAAGCATLDPQDAFTRACATVGEAMAQVTQQRRAGRIDDATFVAIDDAYDAAVATCETPPVTGDATRAAIAKLNEFLARAGGATGQAYSY